MTLTLLTDVVADWFDSVVTLVASHAVVTRQDGTRRRTLRVRLETLTGPRTAYYRASKVDFTRHQTTCLSVVTQTQTLTRVGSIYDSRCVGTRHITFKARSYNRQMVKTDQFIIRCKGNRVIALKRQKSH